MLGSAPLSTCGCQQKATLSPLTFKANVSSVVRLAVARPAVPALRHTRVQPIENRVVLRFSRRGRKKLPFYRLVAVDSRKRRDGRPLEELGWYNPLNKETNLNAPSIKKWLTLGAIPSDTVETLLKKAMVIGQDD